MEYSPELILRLAASLGTPAIYVCFLGSLVAMAVALRIVGRAARRTLIPWEFPHAPLALDVLVGLAVFTALYYVNSLLTRATGWFPPWHWYELPLLAAVVFFLGRKATEGVREDRVVVWAYAALLLVSVVAFGSWHAFSPFPASTDPGVLTTFLDAYREQGTIPSRYSEWNASLPTYPTGAFVMMLAFATPLATSLFLVHVLPVALLTLVAFALADVALASEGAVSRRRILGALALVCGLRVMLGSFEMTESWAFNEGIMKRSLAPFAALALILCVAAARAEVARHAALGYALALWCAGLMAITNQVLAFVTFSIAAAGATAAVLRGRETALRFAVGALLAGVLAVITILQDPYVLKQLGPESRACRLLRTTTPFCTGAAGPGGAAELVDLGLRRGGDRPHWVEYVPDVLKDPLAALLPHRQWIVPKDRPQVAYALGAALVFLGVTVFWRRRESDPRGVGRAALGALPLVVFSVVLGWAQVYAIWRMDSPHFDILVNGYTAAGLLNLWLVAFYGIQALFAVRLGSGFTTRPRAALTTLLLLLVAQPAYERFNQVSYLQRRVQPSYGRDFPPTARVLLGVEAALGDAKRVMTAADIYQMGPERWVFPDRWSAALDLLSEREVELTYLTKWPVMEGGYDSFHKRLCRRRDCAALTELGIDAAVGFTGARMCGRDFTEVIDGLSCVVGRSVVPAAGADASAVVWRFAR